MVVRPVRRSETTAVHSLLRLLLPARANRFDPRLTWVAVDGRLLACFSLAPVPGLDGMFELTGGVHPDFRRQGVGSAVWTTVLPQLPALGIRQLSHPVTDLDSPAARFLLYHQFFIEHEEWLMTLSPLPPRSPSPSPGPILVSLPRPQAIRTFRPLYDRSFGGHPWYQPYSADELNKTLDHPADILFLQKDGRAIGFAWLQGQMIEPIGIVPEEQGKGYGRCLLQSALCELKNRGAAQAQIGVWRQNETAVHLYQSLGFRHEKTLTYLAYTIKD